MNYKVILLVVGLFLAAILPIAYKTFILDLDFFPKLKKDVWELEFTASIPGGLKEKTLEFPVIGPESRVKILSTQWQSGALNVQVKKTKEGYFAVLSDLGNQSTKVYYRVLLQSQDKKYKLPKNVSANGYPKSVRAFLNSFPVSENLEELLSRLETELGLANMNRLEKVKALFYFIHEEILRSDETLGLENTLLYSRGTNLARVNLLTLLLRRQGIPARTIHGIKLLDKKDTKRPWVYWNEVYLGKKWIPVFPIKGYFAEIPAAYIPLYGSIETDEKKSPEGFRYAIFANRLLSDRFSALEYSQELAKKESPFLSFSPYTLPLSEQPALKLLLLFSLGCLVLAVCRNIIGIKTFGIFFPILMALFFKDTSLLFGMGFFAFLLALGYAERFFLGKLHLLAVPRFSIILTLIVLTLLIFAILNHQYRFSPYNPTLLPIIIITMFIERFSIMLEEEGWLNTVKSLAGTLVIALFSYGLFSWKDLELLLYTHPELLFAVIALLILIGKYTGYRLAEFIRFREFLKKQKSYVS